ncbi:P-loop containing nucleoside triphosphate hydrolase protein [Violaceomyces palustris]|uniref:P-loop containing nucleoside triphosphate hydrolase protein n=1 Tax=Violaceomyces palustris TaxID=1673888 RepID=A0ACD0NT44_9BASI|nr:P-loop containing nucleoside triphosphate hydrolase protein [Violaceomyces palustris]
MLRRIQRGIAYTCTKPPFPNGLITSSFLTLPHPPLSPSRSSSPSSSDLKRNRTRANAHRLGNLRPDPPFAFHRRLISSSSVDQSGKKNRSQDERQEQGLPYESSQNKKTLRPYQEECIQDCLSALSNGITRIGVSSPTGSGKTTIFTHLISRLPDLDPTDTKPTSSSSSHDPTPKAKKVMILVGSIELALQAASTVSEAYPDLLVEIEQGSRFKASGLADVTVATYQTLHRSRDRLEKFDPRGFKAVIVDEAHHAAAPSYLTVLSHFDPSIKHPNPTPSDPSKLEGIDDQPEVPIIGFSATFSRHDGLALGKVFDRIVFHKDFLEMIGEKWLCPIRFTSIKADIDLSSVKLNTNSSDFQTSSLASVVNTSVVNKVILKAWLDRAYGRRRSTLIFAVNIQHVEELTSVFRRAGVDARYLHGGTHPTERRELIQDFGKGVYPVLINCSILTEGADVPSIDCILLARPTRSRNLFSQMIGRGMRLSPETKKKDCLILDIVGNIEKGVVCTPTLFGLDSEDVIEDETVESLQSRSEEQQEVPSKFEGEETNPFENLRDPTKLIYIDYSSPSELQRAMSSSSRVVERMSNNSWVDCSGQVYVLDIPRKGFIKVERCEEEEEEGKVWKSNYVAKVSDREEAMALRGPSQVAFKLGFRRPRLVTFATDLESAIRSSDRFAEVNVLRGMGRKGGGNSILSRYAGWRKERASPSQTRLVDKLLGFKRSSQVEGVDEATEKGGSRTTETSSDGLTKGQASVILTRLYHGSKSRWRREVKERNKRLRKLERDESIRERERVVLGPLRK